METGLAKAGIAPLEWNEDSTSEEYEDFFWRFESYLTANGIISTEETATAPAVAGSTQAVALLVCGGGAEIRTAIKAVPNYKTATYTTIKAALDAAFVKEGDKHIRMKWIRMKPEAGETLSHYASRLRVTARKARLETDDNILYHIADDYADINEEIFDKAMKKGLKLPDLLEWSANRDINLKSRHSELKRIEQFRSNQISNRQTFTPTSSNKNYGRRASENRVCHSCGLEYPHENRQCPAKGKSVENAKN